MTRSIRREMRLLYKIKDNEDRYYDLDELTFTRPNTSSGSEWFYGTTAIEAPSNVAYGRIDADGMFVWDAAPRVSPRRGYAPEILSNDTVVATFNEGEDND